MKKIVVFLFLIGGINLTSYAQSIDIEKLSTNKPLKLAGGFNANALFTKGIEQSPLNYFISGYLNLTVFQSLNIPLMINYSDRKVNISQGYSFNQLSIHPTYKWVTAHIGTTNMSFSPYSLNGHQFTGAGVELSPGNWRFQVMTGRLLKAQYQDTLNTGPTFKRTGFGYKLEYNSGKFLLGTTLFKANDHSETLPELKRIFNKEVINPGENTVAGFHFGATFFGKLQLNGEYANSLITKDKSIYYEDIRINTLAGIFHKSNATTESSHAIKLKANYNIATTQTIVGLGYERIDPNYKTFGGYYFVNNLINYTLNLNQILYKGRLTIGGSLGIQQDDIRKSKVSNQNRLVANVNAQARISDKLNMGFMFSNFQSYKFINDTYSKIERIPGEIVDTLNYSLISRSFGYNLTQSLIKNTKRELLLNFQTSYVASQNIQGEMNPSKTDIINSALGLVWRFPEKNAGIQTSLTHFYNGIPNSALTGIGPTVGVQKTFKELFTISLNTSLLQITNKSAGQNYASINTQINGNWKINESNRLSFNTGLVKNQQNNFLNGNLGYNYTFK